MGKPDTRSIDREISKTTRKLEAVRRGETWPLNSSERRTVIGALAGGSYRVLRGKSAARQENRLESLSEQAITRLTAELTALHTERQRIVREHATAKAAKKSSSWW
ncbi:hypothetical protein JCM4814A_76070 [Streptomyces phaeofaciens JCM 4814]|uniref:Uncharacterized protein n=1 Tax=Streptomyces phaeofaciens TaxID=68254 RepID=A0A918HHC5_9ACTN|nr:hypothetical protein [Streptomyces phaeofaciens]GGT64944.1 hypothetical protein GCM10010226_48510 [Streptomyces phaeofaciens]